MKKILYSSILFISILTLTGCLKRDNMEDIKINTTAYPITYITQKLYGKFSKVQSIYPNGANINEYKLTDKQIQDYSSADLFIFNGLSQEKDYVNNMRKENKDLKIIDSTLYMEYTNDMNELWLDPSNMLMMAQNIKKGLNEYIDSYYLSSKIDSNYEKLKINASKLDADIKDTIMNANSNIIVTSDKMFKYLEKYGLTVYVLDENDPNIQITTNEVIKLIREEKIKYIIIKDEENTTVKYLTSNLNVITRKWNTLDNLTETQIIENKDYFNLMRENISILKDELYK